MERACVEGTVSAGALVLLLQQDRDGLPLKDGVAKPGGGKAGSGPF